MNTQNTKSQMNRRIFLCSAAATGAGLMFAQTILTQAGERKAEDINVALIGAGQQGYVLLNTCLKIPGVRFKAVCDIWEAYNQKRAAGLLKKYGHDLRSYVDYREMLDKEKDLDAVIIATPDFRHAEQTIGCLKAGLHIYCEKEMSNNLEDARKMVLAAREAGKLLQIGHQRRSNPRYIHCCEKLLSDAKILGRITTVNGQWNRAAHGPAGWPRGKEIDAATLSRYGFESMDQFMNWRWYKKFGGGPMVDLGSHQIDVYSWFLGANPVSVIASGGTDYYDKKDHEWYDNVMAIFEYQTKQGPVRAFYQTQTANSCNGYFETFMGDQGTLLISEASYRGQLYPEQKELYEQWMAWVKKGYLAQPVAKEAQKEEKTDETKTLYAVETPDSEKRPEFKLPIAMEKPYHQPHLENFFDAIRGKAKLTCPGEIAYESAVAVLKVNEAVEAGRKLEFKPDEFKV